MARRVYTRTPKEQLIWLRGATATVTVNSTSGLVIAPEQLGLTTLIGASDLRYTLRKLIIEVTIVMVTAAFDKILKLAIAWFRSRYDSSIPPNMFFTTDNSKRTDILGYRVMPVQSDVVGAIWDGAAEQVVTRPRVIQFTQVISSMRKMTPLDMIAMGVTLSAFGSDTPGVGDQAKVETSYSALMSRTKS